MRIPRHFCWTKFSSEAGENAESILRRKEAERRANEGLFLWGIGNSIRPSLLSLLELTSDPIVVFTPMLSLPAEHDRQPDSVGVWMEATGLDGMPFPIPAGTTVTSGIRSSGARNCHYALVCQRDTPLIGDSVGWLDDEDVRNLRTGSRVGSSQVTSVVEHLGSGDSRKRYAVAFTARLVAPFQVVLTNCLPQGPGQLTLAGMT